jgi:hypothetical protein
VSDEADLEPMAKRQRLESVVVTIKGLAAPALAPEAVGPTVEGDLGHTTGWLARGPYRGQKRFFPW